MHGAHAFLNSLAIVLCVAAVTTVIFQRLRQPVVLGYLIAGLLVGPHLPFPLVADIGIVQTLAELGVILLMFSLGLEFSLRTLFKVGPTAGITAVIQCSLMVWVGVVVGRALGWTTKESLFTGAIIAISSTTIIAKAFDEQNVKGRLRELVIGILIVEDLIAILLMTLLTAISTRAGLSASEFALTLGKLGGFLAAVLTVGLLIVPRTMRAIVRLQRKETTVVASVGISFALALLAQQFGYSVALGAFLAGMLVAESGEAKQIEHLIEPVRDVFGAIFFVSVGMLIDPALVLEHWGSILLLTLVVVVGKILSVSFGAFLTGSPTRTSVQAGMSLAQIGEFSFIIATMGISLNATRGFLYPIAVAVSAITTLTTPWLIRASGPVANFVDRKLPRRIQTVAALYGSWLESLRSSNRTRSTGAAIRKMVLLLVLDTLLLGLVVIGTSRSFTLVSKEFVARLGVPIRIANLAVIAGAVALAAPFAIGIVRLARRLGKTLAELALPAAPGGKVDLAAAPRRVLLVTLQLACVFILGIPLAAITQPFLPFQAVIVLVLLAVVLAISFWKSAANLQGHVRAGAQVIVEALRSQTRVKDEDALADVRTLMPGLGEPTALQLSAESAAVGKTLAQLNVRGMTGATVLAIKRGESELLLPTAHDVLRDGDVLALAGSHEAIAAATQLLEGDDARKNVPAAN